MMVCVTLPYHRIVPSSSKLVTTISITRESKQDPLGDTIMEHETDIEYLEHVVIEVTLNLSSRLHPNHFYDYNDYYLDKNVLDHEQSRRGDIRINLKSPQGTTSTILPYRETDYINTVGYVKWPFSSLHFWGEDPVGDWKLTIRYRSPVGQVEMSDLKVKLYGTKTIPESVRRIPGHCASVCVRGCASAKESHCDSCKNFSNPITLECIPMCPNGTYEVNGYCIDRARNFTYKYKPEVEKQAPSTNTAADELPKLPGAPFPIEPTAATANTAMATTSTDSTITATPALNSSHFAADEADKWPVAIKLPEEEAEKGKHSAAGSLASSLLFLLTLTTLTAFAMW